MQEYILYTFSGIGIFFIVSIIIAIFCILYQEFKDWISNFFPFANYEKGWLDGRASAFQALETYSWWFSEDDTTFWLLKNLSNKMDVCEAREKWREERKNA